MIERRVQEARRELRVAEARADTAAARRPARCSAPRPATSAAASSQAERVPARGDSRHQRWPRCLLQRALTTEDTEDTEDRTLMRPTKHHRTIIGAAIEVHTALGAGLLESTYDACLLLRTRAMRTAFRAPGALAGHLRRHSARAGIPSRLHRRKLRHRRNQVRRETAAGSSAQLLSYLKLSGIRARPADQLQRSAPASGHPSCH